MKKILCLLLCFSLISVFFACTAYAEEITVTLDGEKLTFDVDPTIVDGSTLVPMRKIFEELGATVKWDGENKTISARKGSKTVSLAIDSNDLTIEKNENTETVSLTTPPQIISSRTLVPIRAISESFGLDVEWNGTKKLVSITSEEEDDSWKNNKVEVKLKDSLSITEGGIYEISGDLDGGNITVNTDDKIKLKLNDVSITSSEPCIFIENADKAFIELSGENELTSTSEKGAIYAKDKLEIKGDGKLIITSDYQGIKASDNLKIEEGSIKISAQENGIHVNDTFEMTGGELEISTLQDGIDSESIVIVSGGSLDITTSATPTENAQPDDEVSRFEATDAVFENSSKGIKACWMMVISGGDIEINSASHAIHCDDAIEISGGEIKLTSEYDKGISAHGNMTIDGCKINIKKSTEGIESKNILTINGGEFDVTSSDDAINATGGRSGEMMGPQGGMAGDMPNGEKPEMPEGMENGENLEMPEGMEQGDFTPPEKPEGMGGGRGFGRGQGGGFGGGNPPEMQGNENGERPEMPEGMEQGDFTPPEKPEGMGGGMGGMSREDLKDCLVINGGEFTLLSGDDGLDSNGNLIINGGTIKATYQNGSFTGNFGILDPDGKTEISENATLIFAASNGNSLSLEQNQIVVYCDEKHQSGDKITLKSSSGEVLSYTPKGSYSAVLLASAKIKSGVSYTITIGNETHEVTLSDKNATIGTKPTNSKNMAR